MIAYCAAAPHSKKIKKPNDIISFDWDKSGKKGTKSNKWTKQEIQEMIKNGTHPLMAHLN